MMSQEEEIRSKRQQDDGNINTHDEHENDMVMPGFRFHPTEEELVEFYLRRKVEGKKFNVELITFLDLYRYDPWELPALAAIGEKEWFFYVPRDRKYRNGDRPNRVTTSGYWKATGADRMIKTDQNSRSIGLKKTLVFYSGKAPKGIRSRWIMNEYRLPQHEFERLQKAEISLCRVYKRTGVECYPSHSRTLQTTRNTSRLLNHDNKQQSLHSPFFTCYEGHSSHHNENNITSSANSIDDLHRIIRSQQSPNNCPPSQLLNIHDYQLNVVSSNYHPHLANDNSSQRPQPHPLLQSSQVVVAPDNLPRAVLETVPDRLWEWNSTPSEGSKDFFDPFK
ncbi:NAC domain-containing protein 35-like [Rutidosis leptorrhynchoides]|uniref:NAC domain-containing protein 35-like n=1 Tax=Rutidosis leptorrhynchoides TaxID=125765 RepID=UPI003A98F9E7